MKIKAFAEKNKYALASFAVLALLSVTYGGFENPAVLALRLLVCLGAALFFSFNVHLVEKYFRNQPPRLLKIFNRNLFEQKS
jgi:hypothetical protein